MSTEISVIEALAKFDRYRADLLPTISTRVQTEGREQFETLVRVSEQWGVLYSGPEGYAKLLKVIDRTITQGHGLPLKELAKRRDAAETALLDVANQFVAECSRLKLS
jgi:hypothetical protein